MDIEFSNLHPVKFFLFKNTVKKDPRGKRCLETTQLLSDREILFEMNRIDQEIPLELPSLKRSKLTWNDPFQIQKDANERLKGP